MRLLLIGHHIVIGRGNSHWLDPIGKLETSRLNVARTQTGSKSASSTKHRVSSICSLSHFARKTRQILPLYFLVVRGCQRGFKLRPSARSEHLTKYSLDRQQYCYYCYTSTAAAGCGWVSISGNLENTIYRIQRQLIYDYHLYYAIILLPHTSMISMLYSCLHETNAKVGVSFLWFFSLCSEGFVGDCMGLFGQRMSTAAGGFTGDTTIR